MPLGASRLSFLAHQIAAAAAAGRTAINFDTVNANSELDTAQKKFGTSSSKHAGNGALIKYTGSNAGPFYQVSGPMTVECFVKINADTGSDTRALVTIGTANATIPRACTLMWRNYDRKFQATYYPVGPTSNQKVQWNGVGMSAVSLPSAFIHVAMAWDNSNWSVWVDGTRIATEALTTTDGSIGTNGNLEVGSGLNVSGDGWVDEVRISSRDRYGVGNSSITVPTAAFIPDNDTLALHHFDGADGAQSGVGFEDDTVIPDRSAISVTASGNAQVDTAQSKFGGASALFDGTNDYLTTAQSSNFTFATDFTIEGFARSASIGTILSNRTVDATGFDVGTLTLERQSNDTLNLNLKDSANIISSATSDNTWFHWAIVRSSGTITLYLDGTSQGTSSNTVTIGSGSHNQLQFGCLGNAVGDYNGYIDEVRVSKVARYTGAFTPTASAFTNDYDTVLLLHCDGADGDTTFEDDTGAAAAAGRTQISIIADGNAQIDTARSKFGSASALFDGSGDYLVIEKNQITPDLSGDFTLEAFVYPTTLSGNNKIFDLRGLNSGTYDDNSAIALGNTLLIDRNGSSFRCFVDGGDKASLTSSEFTAIQWHHIAVQRESGTVNAWVNGVRAVNYAGSDDYSGIFNTNQGIGVNGDAGGLVSFWNGSMDEIRWSTVARYTNGSTITVPTTAFTNDSDTILLLHCDGADGDTTFEDDNS